MTGRKPRPRPVVSAAFTVSWDGRLLESRPPKGKADSQRMTFEGSPAQFRKLLSGGLVNEISIVWSPRIVGGGSTPAITGLGAAFLPHGIALDLLKLERRGEKCIARYRVQSALP